MRVLAGIVLALSAAAAPAVPEVATFDRVLAEFVTADGRVRYSALAAAPQPLRAFVAQLAEVSPDSHPALFPARAQRLAYWLNAYNALVLSAFLDYPENKNRLRGLVSRTRFFYARKFRVGGVERTLDDIETVSLRRGFGDPRIHFAIVCASASCPWLAPRAYRPETVDSELDARTRLFLSQTRNVQVDAPSRTVTLSQIFEWFEKDFGGKADLLQFLARYRPEAASIQLNWKFRYFRYDWSLNEAP